MLKTVRVSLAVIFITAVTLLFVGNTEFAVRHWAWLAKCQFMPALLSLNVIAIVVIAVVTAVMGRVYCSVICPLGIFQDVIGFIRRKTGGRKGRNRFSFKSEKKWLRYGVAALFVMLVVLGFTNLAAMSLAGLLEPYSAYGRVASQIFAPAADGVNNLLADWSAEQGNYLFSHVAYVTRVPLLIVAAVTLIVVVLMAWFGGRDYCNKICPVGTILGLIGRAPLLRPVIDMTKCNGCRKCERNCKSSCIDGAHHKIDYSRCVVCMDCIGNCSQGAISYRLAPRKTNVAANDQKPSARRKFIATGLVFAGALAAKAHEEGDGALAPLKLKRRAVRLNDVVPAGARSVANLRSRCTACQLCVTACPESVLQPSTDAVSLLQPVMWFNKGYCRTDCTRCSDVCPAGAIVPVTVEEKSSIKIGTAVVDADRCIWAADGKHCGLCSRSCPTKAIRMVRTSDMARGHKRPVVNESACIGCGSCEYHCPVGTAGRITSDRAAIYVEGLSEHRVI